MKYSFNKLLFSYFLCVLLGPFYYNNLLSMEKHEIEITKKQKIEDPLVAAIENNNIEEIQKAVASGSDPNRKLINHNPLAWAILHNNDNLIIFLLAHGADVSLILEPNGISFYTLIDAATNLTDFDKNLIRETLRAHQQTLEKDEKYKLEQFLLAIQKEDFNRAKELLSADKLFIQNIDINSWLTIITQSLSTPYNPLLNLVIEIFTSSIEDGINLPLIKNTLSNISLENFLKIKNEQGDTLLHSAAQNANAAVIALILEHYPSIDINIQNTIGQTPLMLSIRENPLSTDINTFTMLLNAGSDVNISDFEGDTALHLAVLNIDFDIGLLFIKSLREAGADITKKNNDGETPADLISDGLKNLETQFKESLQ